MKIVRRTIWGIALQAAAAAILAGPAAACGFGPFMVPVFLIIAALDLWLIFFVAVPAARTSKKLELLLKEECSDTALTDHDEELPYLTELLQLVDRYSAFRMRGNAAQIFDKQTELTALQSQINPHFLYNTLESIRGQALMDDNFEIARMVEALGSFFRYSISRKGNLVTLREELTNIQNYMLIQRYRFNNRLSLEVLVDEEDEAAYEYLVPRLIIQPVVENAIFHGLEDTTEDGRITIEVIVTQETLILTISDNGKGMPAETLEHLNARLNSDDVSLEDGTAETVKGTGIALPNIQKRIRLLFGDEYGLCVYSTKGQGTDVEITIPIREKRTEHEERDSEDTASEL